jgi:two-component system cell cycle sensor histidine kinase/response regulator CckA
MDTLESMAPAPTQPAESLAHLVRNCRPLLSQLPLGCAIADTEFRAVFWNAACERIFGFSEAEILGKTPYETVVPSAASDAIRRVHSSTADEKLRTHSDNVNVTKDGRLLRCRWHNAPLHSPAGELIGMVSMVLEFTERDLELEAAHERETQVRSALNAAPEAMLTLDDQGVVQTSNREAERLFGYAASDLCGVHIGRLLPEESWFCGGVFGPPAEPAEVGGVRSDGSRFVARVSVGSANLLSRKYFTAIVQNLSKQRAAERQVQEQRRMEALGRLAGGVAHDFNNLLTVILGASSMLLRGGAKGPRTGEQLEAIFQACERAAALTAQLLAFSKQRVGSPEPLDINEVVRGALSLLARIVGERWSLVTRYATSDCIARVDRGQLEQVLMNLVTNARDAMSQGGLIQIETFHACAPHHPHGGLGDTRREFVGLAVTDTGEGIDPELQAHIFEPFFTTKAAGKGTGLGLATVYGIVEQAGGSVRVESVRGKGARFEVCLPSIGHSAVLLRERFESERVASSLAGRTVLLVEDDEQVRATTAQMLIELGLSVQAAAHAAQAIELASQQPFDLLVTDLVLPGTDGRALALEIRGCQPKLPILFITGYTRDSTFHRGETPEQSQLLQKPFSLEMLSKALSELARRTPAGE